jgi:hypothetical protein
MVTIHSVVILVYTHISGTYIGWRLKGARGALVVDT